MRIAFLALFGATVLLVPVLWNGVPLLFFDSGAYLSRPNAAVLYLMEQVDLNPGVLAESGIPVRGTALISDLPDKMRMPVVEGRSIYYGMLVYAGYLTGKLWPLVIMQALMVSSMLALFWHRVMGFTGGVGFAVLVIGLMLTTPIAFFVGLVMPDFLAPLLILAAAMLLAAWPRLKRGDKWFLAAAVSLAMVSHTSHLLLGAVLLMLVAIVRLTLRWPNPPFSIRGMAVLAGAVLVTLSLNALFTAAVVRATGQAPILRPHITAHLVDNGPAIAYLDRNCPGSGFVICDYRDRLPMGWEKFLFATDPAAGLFNADDIGPDIRRALSAEQTRLAWAILVDDPVGMVRFSVHAGIRQLGLFAVDEIALDATRLPSEGFPLDLVEATRASPLYADNRPLQALSLVTYISALAALGGLVLAVATGSRRLRDSSDVRVTVIVLILLGVLLNAVICGVLASPYDRFQARVIWLLPLAAVMALYLARTPDRVRVPSLPKV